MAPWRFAAERSEVWDRRWRLLDAGAEPAAWAEAARSVRAAADEHLGRARTRAEQLVGQAVRGLCPGRRVEIAWRG